MSSRNLLKYTILLGALALFGCKEKSIEQSSLELELAKSHASKAWAEAYNPKGDKQKTIKEYEKALSYLDQSDPLHRDQLFMTYREIRDFHTLAGNTEKIQEMSQKLMNLSKLK